MSIHRESSSAMDAVRAAAGSNTQPATDGVTAIELTHISKRYCNVQAVNDLSLTVHPGEVIALLGPNGAGKTTTIDIALGMITSDSGSATLFGMDPHTAIRRGLVGVVQQSDTLRGEMTVAQMVKMIAATHGKPRSVDEVFAATGIAHLANRKVQKCSGGEKQRIRLAIALLSDPFLLILDEPTTGMDVDGRREFWEFMEREARRGRSIVFATHYLAEAESYAARTIIMRNGEIIADGSTAALRDSFAHYTLLASYSGEEAALKNVLAGCDCEVVCEPGKVKITGKDLDEVARIALGVPGIRHVTITQSSLEDVYTTLVEAERA
ncbi:ABC transporter ATP-binding protein [Trueperella sp. LYQ143]|uniref:ABC transporter ATP-binding protein n=1 Tax=Trueperella sp. LYQ143 TaxID=3391059 RepID=UPI003983B2FA